MVHDVACRASTAPPRGEHCSWLAVVAVPYTTCTELAPWSENEEFVAVDAKSVVGAPDRMRERRVKVAVPTTFEAMIVKDMALFGR
jgi:hypothetical protein